MVPIDRVGLRAQSRLVTHRFFPAACPPARTSVSMVVSAFCAIVSTLRHIAGPCRCPSRASSPRSLRRRSPEPPDRRDQSARTFRPMAFGLLRIVRILVVTHSRSCKSRMRSSLSGNLVAKSSAAFSSASGICARGRRFPGIELGLRFRLRRTFYRWRAGRSGRRAGVACAGQSGRRPAESAASIPCFGPSPDREAHNSDNDCCSFHAVSMMHNFTARRCQRLSQDFLRAITLPPRLRPRRSLRLLCDGRLIGLLQSALAATFASGTAVPAAA